MADHSKVTETSAIMVHMPMASGAGIVMCQATIVWTSGTRVADADGINAAGTLEPLWALTVSTKVVPNSRQTTVRTAE